MPYRVRRIVQKVLCAGVICALLWVPALAARARTTTIVVTTGSARAIVDGRTVTMLVPPVIDQPSQQLLVPLGFIAKCVGFSVISGAPTATLQLTSGEHTSLVTTGKPEAFVDGRTVELSSSPRGLLGEVLVAASDVQLLLPVEYSRGSSDRESVFTRLVDLPVAEGTVDTGAVTLQTYRQQVFLQTADFFVVRIDMSGKGVRVISGQSAGGAGTARYPSAYIDSLKPLALMNATPFSLTSHVMSGSVQDEGTPVSYSGTYVSTIGIDRNNAPFYAEGTARAVVRLDSGKDLAVARVNRAAAESSSQSISLYSNYYVGGLSIGPSEVLAIVADGRITRLISGAYFTPRTLLSGQVALYARHPTTVNLLRTSVTAEVRSFVGDRDCTGATFVQCGPVVVRAGKPYIDYRKYKDISRTTKLGARAFVGIDGQRHLYFIVTPAHVRLQFGDVSLALSRLGLFTDVLTLDGGSSTTLYYNGQYLIKGTRAVTNVLYVPSA
ncbi:MAG: stalk domain-containing protein [Candidatus Cryosericum sp.]